MASSNITEQSSSRFVQTKKWKIHYNEAGAGQAIIMLHGTGPGATGWSNFNQNLISLSEKYRVIAIDAPGWGKSDPLDPTQCSRAVAHAEAVKLLMDELGIEKAALVGNSMGGSTTTQFAQDFPERLSHYITMGAGLFGRNIFSPGGRMTEGLKIVWETYKDPSPANFRRLVEIMVYDSSFATDALMEQRSQAASANKAHLENWLKGYPDPRNPPLPQVADLAKLGKLAVPALIIHGRDDRVVPMEGSLRAVTVIPNSRLLIFNRCGHWAQVEHAQEFNEVVDAFVSFRSQLSQRGSSFGG